MEWTKLKQKKKYLQGRSELGGDLYKGNLLILGDIQRSDVLCCWNIATNSWSSFDIQKIGSNRRTGNMVVYKSLLLACIPDRNGLGLEILNLENIGLPTTETTEETHLQSLFMNEEDADIGLRVENIIIPAHKEVLIENSRYFANLFNSGMVESRQDIIDIQGCEYSVFQEFLRFIYCNEVKLDVDLAIKLFVFSDKYLQNDLNEKCIEFLTHNLTSDNIYKILEFAREKDIPHLKNWCMKYFENNINRNSVSGLIKFLNQQSKQEFVKENFELRKKALDVVMANYVKIYLEQKDHILFYEDFLIRHVNQDTILKFVKFITRDEIKELFPKPLDISELNRLRNETKATFDEWNINLRPVVMNFIKDNFELLKVQEIAEELPKVFFIDFSSYLIGALTKQERKNFENENKADNDDGNKKFDEEEKNDYKEDNMKIQDDEKIDDESEGRDPLAKEKRGIKRKEPVQDEIPEEEAELKKTKKSSM